MKIDLHCHTKSTKKNDGINRDVPSAQYFKDAINNEGVRMVAITNHNCFDLNQYNEFKTVVGNDFILLPGIELDVVSDSDNKDHGHVIIVCSEDDAEIFSKKVNELIDSTSPDDFTCCINDVTNIATSFSDCVVLAHDTKKPNLKRETLEDLEKKIVGENRSFFYETSNIRSSGIVIDNGNKSLFGSDVQDWEKYPGRPLPEIKFNIDSFHQLVLFFKRDRDVIQKLLDNQTHYDIDVSYKQNKSKKETKSKSKKKVPEEIVTLYDGINVIFGGKATGKSVCLDSIYEYFLKKGMEVSCYKCGPDNDKDKSDKEKLNSKLNVSDEDKDRLLGKSFDNLKKEFKEILNWKESGVTQISDYYKHFELVSNSANLAKMKIINISTIPPNTHNLETERTNFSYYISLESSLKSINLDSYLSLTEKEELEKNIKILGTKMYQKYLDTFIEYESVLFSNGCVSNFKKTSGQNTGTKAIPGSTKFIEYSREIFSLSKSLMRIMGDDGFGYTNSFEDSVGKLENGRTLKICATLHMLNADSKLEDGFASGIQPKKDIRKYIFDLKDCLFDREKIIDNINAMHSKIKDSKDTNELSMENFIGIRKEFLLDDNTPYKPSNGQSTMIILNRVLDNSDASVFLLDEPEENLSNDFVCNTLLKRLVDIEKERKMIVLVTHNANLAVRTLPYCSILKTHEGNEYKTYLGNPYTDKMYNICDNNDTKNWRHESVTILEGGKEAFEERGDIYDFEHDTNGNDL